MSEGLEPQDQQEFKIFSSCADARLVECPATPQRTSSRLDGNGGPGGGTPVAGPRGALDPGGGTHGGAPRPRGARMEHHRRRADKTTPGPPAGPDPAARCLARQHPAVLPWQVLRRRSQPPLGPAALHRQRRHPAGALARTQPTRRTGGCISPRASTGLAGGPGPATGRAAAAPGTARSPRSAAPHLGRSLDGGRTLE